MPKTQAELLDDNHANVALGGELVPLYSESESTLSQTRRAERIRARSELLARVLRPEPVRRMVRKAGITSYATSSPANEHVDVVLKTLQQIADVILFNVSFELCRLCEHLRRRTVTEELLGEALKTFGVKLHGACDETHKSCPTLKHRIAGAAAAHVLKGAESEISHEFDNESCVYFAYAPFVKLLRAYLAEQTEHPPKMTRGVISCVQFELEKTLVEILQKARYVVRQATKGKKDSSIPSRTTVNSRDIKLVLTVLAHRHPILSGRMRALDDPSQSPRRGSPRGARAKAAPKPAAKAKAHSRATASARAKAGS